MEIYLDASGARMSSDARNLSLDDIKWLLIAYAVLVAVKAILSLKFQSPWIFPDESTYAIIARDIWAQHWGNPCVYSFFLSVAYIFSTDMKVVYHIMLVINCLLSSTALFPSYFILAKFCPNRYSLAGSFTVATLPSLTLYSFLLMTENLFVPLFLFSIWFAVEAYETRKFFWVFMLVFSVIILFFTRHTGIFMVAGLALSFGYFISTGLMRGSKANTMNLRDMLLLLGLLVFLISLSLYALESKFPWYFRWFWDRIMADGMVFMGVVSNLDSLTRFTLLLTNELGYVIVSSYFIIFLLAGVFVFSMFGISRVKSPSISSWFNSLSPEKACSLKTVALYFLLPSLCMVFWTTVSVYRLDVDLIGRYVDPIIPGLFLFAFIGLYQIYESEDLQSFWKYLVLLPASSLVFFLKFPFLTPNIISVFYLNYFKGLFPNWLIFPVLSSVFFAVMYFSRNSSRLLFICLILFSACTSAYTYNADLSILSGTYSSQNQVGDYLNQHTNASTLVLVDTLDVKRDNYLLYPIQFWSKGQVALRPIPENVSTLKKYSSWDLIYIISSSKMPLPVRAISTRDYSLYEYDISQ